MGALVVIAIVVGVAALVTAVVALNAQRRVRRAYAIFSMGSRDDVLTLLQRHLDEVGRLRGEVAAQKRFGDDLRERARGAVSGVGIVRYDAFDDMGGHLSFSTALLDERGDGVVVSAINGRSETRIYAKPVVRGDSRHNLSSEEIAAISEALTSAGGLAGTKRRPRAVGSQPAADAS
jgi:hypothetical protein